MCNDESTRNMEIEHTPSYSAPPPRDVTNSKPPYRPRNQRASKSKASVQKRRRRDKSKNRETRHKDNSKYQSRGNDTSHDSVKVIFQTLSCSQTLTDLAAHRIYKDVIYRMRILIQDSLKYMKHCKRKRLTIRHVNSAMYINRIAPIFGHAHTRTKEEGDGKDKWNGGFTEVDGVKRGLFYMKERAVRITEFIEGSILRVPADVTIVPKWISFEGNAMCESTRRTREMMGERSEMRDERQVKKNVGKFVKYNHIRHRVSNSFMTYLKVVQEICIGGDLNAIEICCDQLRNNFDHAPILPYLVANIYNGMTKEKTRLGELCSYMRCARALLENKKLNIEIYLHQLLASVMTCVVREVICENANENHWILREFCAMMLEKVCLEYGKRYPNMVISIMKDVETTLCDMDTPLCTIYGCVICLTFLGRTCLKINILGVLQTIASRLIPALQIVNRCVENQFEAIKVFGAIIWSVLKLRQGEDDRLQIRIEEVQEVKLMEEIGIENAKVFDGLYKQVGDCMFPCSNWMKEGDMHAALLKDRLY